MFKSLKQRLTFIIIIPLALMLLLSGSLGFIYAREKIFKQWQESSLLKLQRAAHLISMRLDKPMEWMSIFIKVAGENHQPSQEMQKWFLSQFRTLEGVERVDLKWIPQPGELNMMSRGSMGAMMGGEGQKMMEGRDQMMRFRSGRPVILSSPKYDPEIGTHTVSLISYLIDSNDEVVGEFEVALNFDYLMKDVVSLSWWQADKACLVDSTGRYIAHTAMVDEGKTQLGARGDPFNLKILQAIRTERDGVVFSDKDPQKEVAGFYALKNVPWALIVFAPREKILAPILKFRMYYFLFGTLIIAGILLYVRASAGKTVKLIRVVSDKAQRIASGDYGEPLQVKSRDEIGQLTESFNVMVEGLKQKDFLHDTFGRYVDRTVANELLNNPSAAKLGGIKREVAILMSDLRGFTPLCETLEPEKIIRIINRYFSHMISIIERYHGIIVDFFGDAVLVFFDPLDGPVAEKVKAAVNCASEMQRAMIDFNREGKAAGLPELSMGVGVHADKVVVGNIGSETRAKYGVVGAPVNFTARIQSIAKEGEVIVTESILSHLKDKLHIDRKFNARLKGVAGEATLYAIRN